MQLTFEWDVLKKIQIEIEYAAEQPPEWQGFADISGVPVERPLVLEYLRDQGLTWEVDPLLSYGEVECLQASSGAALLFEVISGQLLKVWVSSM